MSYGLKVILFIIGTVGSMAISLHITTDEQAFEYCLQHKNSFIAIVWPIAQGKDAQILEILHAFGEICYQKKVYFTYNQVAKLLAQAHPKIIDIESHVAWYFPPGTIEKPARIFVMQFRNNKTADACKHAVRKLFGMQYRPIHINDYHYETIELAKFFFLNDQTKNPFSLFCVRH